MRRPALTKEEMLLREILETEEVLREISAIIGCTCIIDPTETLADRVAHLGYITALLAQAVEPALAERRAAVPTNYVDLLRRVEEN